jgi:GT2 family glycosyltransferase
MTVSAVILAYRRPHELAIVLDRLGALPVDEVLVVHNGDGPEIPAVAQSRPGVRILDPQANLGIGGRNLAAQEARGELLLMLDDDSYPLPGAVEAFEGIFAALPRLGAAGGLVRDIDASGEVLLERELGTFDWFLRAGRKDEPGVEGWPAFFFPEGASMLRREAFLEVGGFFEPYFFHTVELDLATRLLGAGWDVRYVPGAKFDHMKAPFGRVGFAGLEYRVRNQLWYFWLHFPAWVAALRIPAYLAFDLIECMYRGVTSAWWRGVSEAWRQRDAVRGARRPLSRKVIRRAELNRGRLHFQLLLGQLRRQFSASGRQ